MDDLRQRIKAAVDRMHDDLARELVTPPPGSRPVDPSPRVWYSTRPEVERGQVLVMSPTGIFPEVLILHPDDVVGMLVRLSLSGLVLRPFREWRPDPLASRPIPPIEPDPPSQDHAPGSDWRFSYGAGVGGPIPHPRDDQNE